MTDSTFGNDAGGTIYLEWTPAWVGAIVAAALSFVLLAFGSALGLAVASPSSSWRDTSAVFTLLSGLWLLLTAIASFGLGGYLAGRLRVPLRPHSRDEVEFRDGIHGLLVWAIAILIGASLRLRQAVPLARGEQRMRNPRLPQLPSRSLPWSSISCFVLIASRLIQAIRNLEHKPLGLFRLVWVTAPWRQRIAVTLFDW
jgi:hypothetical protein